MHMTIFGSNDDLSFFYGSCCFCTLCDFVYHFIGYTRLSCSFYLKKDEFHKHRCHLSVREGGGHSSKDVTDGERGFLCVI